MRVCFLGFRLCYLCFIDNVHLMFSGVYELLGISFFCFLSCVIFYLGFASAISAVYDVSRGGFSRCLSIIRCWFLKLALVFLSILTDMLERFLL